MSKTLNSSQTMWHQMKEREARWDKEGLTHEDRLQRILADESNRQGQMPFQVDERWCVEWDDIEQDAETAHRIREHPQGWVPASWDNFVGSDF